MTLLEEIQIHDIMRDAADDHAHHSLTALVAILSRDLPNHANGPYRLEYFDKTSASFVRMCPSVTHAASHILNQSHNIAHTLEHYRLVCQPPSDRPEDAILADTDLEPGT
jgi:hypothetical protein